MSLPAFRAVTDEVKMGQHGVPVCDVILEVCQGSKSECFRRVDRGFIWL
jgi:hypothetical protein